MKKTTIIEIIKNIQDSEFKAFNSNADKVVYTIDTSVIPKYGMGTPINFPNIADLKLKEVITTLHDVQKSDLKALNLNSDMFVYSIDTTSIETIATKNNNVNLFNILMNNVKAGYDSDSLDVNELYALASFIVLAELKNAIDPNRYRTTNKAGKSVTKPTGTFPLFLYDLKNTVMGQMHQLTKVYDDGKTADDYITLNKKGDLIVDTVQLNKDMDKLYYGLYNGSSNDAADLIQSTVLYLLEELEYMKVNSVDSFETVRTERVPNKKIYIKVEDSANYWKDIDVCGIQLIYKKLRSEINEQRTVKEAINNNYCYYQYETETDNDNQNKDIYIRVPKYSVLISANEYGLNTVSQCDYERLKELVEGLNLTDFQTSVLEVRLKHTSQTFDYRAIGTYLGVSHNSVKSALREIRRKAAILADRDANFEKYLLEATQSEATRLFNELVNDLNLTALENLVLQNRLKQERKFEPLDCEKIGERVGRSRKSIRKILKGIRRKATELKRNKHNPATLSNPISIFEKYTCNDIDFTNLIRALFINPNKEG